ncbi:cytochrome P450 6k1-like [Oratosquilla oratoria]|uniref:cytochrome P450 6k1-like n=1 Tax=Oratosquilla oratoria TaxID=337810 RepID=UPI003F772027
MLVTLALVFTVGALLFAYCHYCHQYWQSRGVFVPPLAPVIGHLLPIWSVTENRFEYVHKLFKKTKAPYFGVYEILTPSLYVRDLAMLKNILVKDFAHFTDRRPFETLAPDKELKEMVFFLEGDDWKGLRSIISPAFTSGKLKSMFPLMEDKCKKLVEYLKEHRGQSLEMKALFSRFTLEVIATCAFGIKCNFLEDENDPFALATQQFSQPSFVQGLKYLLVGTAPWLMHLFNIRLFDSSVEILAAFARESLKTREITGRRGDFLDLMMDAMRETKQNGGKGKYAVTEETIICQAVLFLIAGFETTATSLAYTSYVLANHPEVQQKVREEVQLLLKTHGEIDYQLVAEAKFLEACFNECLRLYPALPVTERMCVKDYTIPGTDLRIEKGMCLGIPIYTLNRDPELFEDPDSFKPERFLPENKTSEKVFAFQTFGQGPRSCIGMRFALLEAKLALAHMIVGMEFLPDPERKNPLTFAVNPSELLTPAEGIPVIVKPL